jgi:hypothetical protein
MTSTVRRHTQWVFQALELGYSGVRTVIDRGLSSIAEIEHLDQLPSRAWVTRQGSRSGVCSTCFVLHIYTAYDALYIIVM